MPRRTIEISRHGAHLAMQQGQLLIIPKHTDEEASEDRRWKSNRPDLAHLGSINRRIPVEDIGLLIVDHAHTTYTHNALASLAKAGTCVVVCGEDHIPTGMLIPFSSHTTQVWRVADQIRCRTVLRKQLWQALVSAKIHAQALNLPEDEPIRSGLLDMARSVRSGDTDNTEARAARVYWKTLFPPTDSWQFRRQPGQGIRRAAPPNNLLDYGYAILRAAMARALVGAGLLPVIGIQHSNRSNAFCLADDLVEPLRPMIDRRAKALFDDGQRTLDQPAKARLLLVLSATVRVGKGSTARCGPLDVALGRYATSLARSYASGKVELLIPVEESFEDDANG